MPAPPLTLDDILAWCDLHKQRRGKYPVYTAGPVVDGPLGLNWRKIDNALRLGLRGLEGGSSLARLLAEHRGYRNVQALPPLTEDQIAQWARAHTDRSGGIWPNEHSGDIPEALGETWCNINAALRDGHRGLPGNDTLAELLARRLGLRTQVAVPALSVATILAWAGEHKAASGQWPKRNSGPVISHPGETWVAINAALEAGARGLPAGSSLAQLLDQHRGVPNKSRLPRLTVPMILRFADTWHGRTGEWPTSLSGAIPQMLGLTWKAVNLALHQGLRGLPGGGRFTCFCASGGRFPSEGLRRKHDNRVDHPPGPPHQSIRGPRHKQEAPKSCIHSPSRVAFGAELRLASARSGSGSEGKRLQSA